MTKTDAAVMADLAPTGKLRAALNFGNPVLVQKHPDTSAPQGITVDLATELGKRLGVAVEFVPFDGAGKVVEAIKANAWDVAFLAIDPLRAAEIAFTAPYVIIEATYLVPADSPLQTIEDVDAAGIRIAVVKNAAYDLYLTRALKHAQLVRAPLAQASLEMFLSDGLEAVAGIKQPLHAFAKGRSDVRVMPGRFMAIEQAMGIPKNRTAGAHFLGDFVEEMKSSGFVAKALETSGQREATVAPSR